MDLCFPRQFLVKFPRQVSCQVSSSSFLIRSLVKSLAKFLVRPYVKLNVCREILSSNLIWNFVVKANMKFCHQVWHGILPSSLTWNFVVKFMVKFIVKFIVKFLVKFPRQISSSNFLVKFPRKVSSSNLLSRLLPSFWSNFMSNLTWNFVVKSEVKFCCQVWREISPPRLMWNFVVKADVKFCHQAWR